MQINADHPDLPRFYSSDIRLNTQIVLQDDESKHIRVLRLSPGDEVHLIDGKGQLFKGTIETTGKNTKVLPAELLESIERDQGDTTLLVAPTKNMNRFEWVIEKATEIGVERIVPILCQHSERTQLKVERLNRIAISAAKQSKDLFIPVIDELTPLEIAFNKDVPNKWIAHCQSGNHVPLSELIKHPHRKLIAIGPEGDFDPFEVELALSLGFKELTLGKKRLRTETAAITAIIASTMFQ